MTLMKTSPLAHQSVAFERFKDKAVCALLWPMGRGKTKTAIDIMVHKFMRGEICRVLIIAPNTVHSQWVNEQLPAHCAVPYVAHAFKNLHTQRYRRELSEFKDRVYNDCAYNKLAILAVHVDAFSYGTANALVHNFCENGRTLFILDEATRIKNPKSRRTKEILALRKRFGGPAIILTATALAKRPADAWSLFTFLDPDILNCTYATFEARHTVMKSKTFEMLNGKKVQKNMALDEFSWKQLKWELKRRPVDIDRILELAYKFQMTPNDIKFVHENPTFVKYKHIDELKNQLKPYADFLPDTEDIQLPPKRYETIVLDSSAEQKRAIKELKSLALAEYGGQVITVQNAAALQMRALQICGGFFPYEEDGKYQTPIEMKQNPKLEYLLEEMDEVGDSQFLVFAAFSAEVNMLYERLSKVVSIGRLDGSVTKENREIIVSKFKDREIQGIVCNPYVAGYGLNLQGATVQYWYSRNFNTEDRIQAEGRSHRIGIVESPVYKDLVLDVKFEQNVLNSVRDGRNLNDYFNGATIDSLLKL